MDGLVAGRVSNWVFVAASWLFILGLLDVVALARSVLMHGILRGQVAARGNDV